jgi:serine/threonine protein kinase
MPSKLKQYVLKKTLGQGSFSKVKLALNKENGTYYAIKIHRKDDPKFDRSAREVVQSEALAMSQINHPNIVNIVEYMPEATIEKSDGSTYDVFCVIVEDLAEGGELFFFVKNSGYFTEKVARYFMIQILQGLSYIHSQGLAHRDIKPDNILLDSNFNIKVADFGFAGPLAGRHGDGYLYSKLGTEPYQAPEINLGQAYQGAQVDLFATAIVLFITVAGTPPFTKAVKDEFYYKLIAGDRMDMFWRYHEKSKPTGKNFFSDNFKDLMKRMLAFKPEDRLSTEELYEHPWFKDQPLPAYEEIVAEFRERHRVN